MPKVKQYGGPTTHVNPAPAKDADFTVKNLPLKILSLKENSTALGQLYFSKPLQEIGEQSHTLFLGVKEYRLVHKSHLPIDVHAKYIQTIMKSALGFIKESQYISTDSISIHRPNILAHIFCSILAYNDILFYPKIEIHKLSNNVCLGEALVYYSSDAEETLHLYLSLPAIDAIFKDVEFPIIYSEDLRRATACKTQFAVEKTKISDSMGNGDFTDVQKTIMSLHILADHAATHYIEEYINNSTDMIQHLRFAQELPGFTTTHIAFRVSANIQQESNQLKLQASNTLKPAGTSDTIRDLFKLKLTPPTPLSTIPLSLGTLY